MCGILSNHLSRHWLSGFYEKLFPFTQNHLHRFKIIGGKAKYEKINVILIATQKDIVSREKKLVLNHSIPIISPVSCDFFVGEKKNNSE